MTLRARLAAILAVAVTVPTAAALLVIGTTVPHRLDAQVRARAQSEAVSAAALLARSCQQAETAVELLGRRSLTGDPAVLVRDAVIEQGASAALLTGAGGAVIAQAGNAPASATGGAECLRAGQQRALAARISVHGSRAGVREAVLVYDPSRAVRALGAEGMRLILTASGHQVGHVGRQPAGRTVSATLPAGAGHPFVITATVGATSYGWLRGLLGALAAVVLAGSLLLARRVAQIATAPLETAARAACRIAGGDLSTRVPESGDDEIGQVARSFNSMAGSLAAYVAELERSRSELQRSMVRLGQTLSGTHDPERIAAVVLETAMVTSAATSGALTLNDPDGQIHLSVRRGEQPADPEATLAVPIEHQGRQAGVLELHDKVDGNSFSEQDLQAVRALAGQAAVAVRNVSAHQEAERLSVTDGLTGLWNRRFLNLALRREIERALRYGHDLTVLAIDVDRFKLVNDTYGHGRGDTVLVELARRLRNETRDSDIVARPGGEEFVVLLPETDVAGAVRACERLCAAMRRDLFRDEDGPELAVTISIGAAVLPRDGTTQELLLAAADAALYQAKDGGRDGWRLAAGAEQAGSAHPQLTNR